MDSSGSLLQLSANNDDDLYGVITYHNFPELNESQFANFCDIPNSRKFDNNDEKDDRDKTMLNEALCQITKRDEVITKERRLRQDAEQRLQLFKRALDCVICTLMKAKKNNDCVICMER